MARVLAGVLVGLVMVQLGRCEWLSVRLVSLGRVGAGLSRLWDTSSR